MPGRPVRNGGQLYRLSTGEKCLNIEPGAPANPGNPAMPSFPAVEEMTLDFINNFANREFQVLLQNLGDL